MFFEKRKSRPPLTLNVTALIDICSLILIFLVMESYFGESSIVVPTGMAIPKSISKESVENAPKILITDREVTASFLPQPIPLNVFRGDNAQLTETKAKIKAFVGAIPAQARTSGVLLNLIADQKAPYKDIFDVVAVFREAGFQSILFVAQANGDKK
jgi:biopolymer transport protein ExbD